MSVDDAENVSLIKANTHVHTCGIACVFVFVGSGSKLHARCSETEDPEWCRDVMFNESDPS